MTLAMVALAGTFEAVYNLASSSQLKVAAVAVPLRQRFHPLLLVNKEKKSRFIPTVLSARKATCLLAP